MPEFDLALLHAGEQSGRLDQCFRMLSGYYSARASLAREFLMGLAYPAFLFHFAIFLLPFIDFFKTGDFAMYLLRTFGVLLPVYGVTAALIIANQSRMTESWRAFVEEVLHIVPLLGTARRELALSRFASALEALLTAGVMIVEAWQLAGAASGSPALKKLSAAWRRPLSEGNTPADLIMASTYFPPMFSSQYATAEISGQLDTTLKRLAKYYLEEGSRKLKMVAVWTPRMLYLCVAGMIAYQVIKLYLGYFALVREAGGF